MLLQVAEYGFPLITLPYLVHVLGPAKFGALAFAQALIQYFIMFTDYGFGLSATREISTNRNDRQKIASVFAAVMGVKTLIAAACLLLLLLLIAVFPIFGADPKLYLISFGLVISSLLFPQWLFQGLEKMEYITVFNVVAKAIFTLLLFGCVHSEADYLRVPLLNAAGGAVAGIAAIVFALKKFKLQIARPSLKEIKHQAGGGWYIFLSLASTSLYTNSNTFVLGLFAAPGVVGCYSASEKIVRILIRLFQPLQQALYPYIAQLAAETKKKALFVLRIAALATASAGFILFALAFTFAGRISALVLGSQYDAAPGLIRIFAPLLVVVPLAAVFANLMLIPFKLEKRLSRIYLCGGFFNFVLLLPLVYLYGGTGAAFSTLATESALTAAMYVTLSRKGLGLHQGL